MRMKNITRWVVLLCLWSLPIHAAEPEPLDPEPLLCPEGYTCLKNELYEQVKEALEKLRKLETTDPVVKLDPVIIVVDRQGRVFSSGKDPSPAKGKISWGDFEVDIKWAPKLTVSQVVEKEFGFRPRVKAQLWFNILDFDVDDWERFVDFGIAFEPFYVYWANFQVFVGFRSFGAALGADITKNFGIVAGVSFVYRRITSPSPMVGLYFSFN